MNNPSLMGIKAIRQELESMGIVTTSFIEKSEFVNALLDARNERKARCADCGNEEGDGVGLKTCRSCMLVKYCSAKCQKKHWPEHKKLCKQRAAELRDEALFKDPPAKEDCPICLLPMPAKLMCCISLQSATVLSVPIYDFVKANEGVADENTEEYYPCCGKNICRGCIHSFCKSENNDTCPFCNSDRGSKTPEDNVDEIKKRIEANDPVAMCVLAVYHEFGGNGLLQDREKARELYARAAELGSSKAHFNLGFIHYLGEDFKKAKFHYEAAAMAGHDAARNNLGTLENKSGNMGRAVKHWIIAASAGCCYSMNSLRPFFELGVICQESINSTLTAYNNSCAKMRSKARDSFISKLAKAYRSEGAIPDCILQKSAAKLCDEALFKDPPAKEDCPICFLPMPMDLISCASLPPATIKSVPVYDYVEANKELASTSTKQYYPCCGKGICAGCLYSINSGKCPFCNSDIKTDEEMVAVMKRVEAFDPASIFMLAQHYYHGDNGLQQDRAKALELYATAAELGSRHAHFFLGGNYEKGGDAKKAKFHYEAAAMAGDEAARYKLGCLEGTGKRMGFTSDTLKRAIKHWTIAASSGDYRAMNTLIDLFKKGLVSREPIDSTLATYNNSCAEMRSKDRDAAIRMITETRLGEDGEWEKLGEDGQWH
jgi:TPR repeat protein